MVEYVTILNQKASKRILSHEMAMLVLSHIWMYSTFFHDIHPDSHSVEYKQMLNNMEIFIIIIITAFFFFYFLYKEGKNTDNYIKNRLKELSKITIMDNNEIKLLKTQVI